MRVSVADLIREGAERTLPASYESYYFNSETGERFACAVGAAGVGAGFRNGDFSEEELNISTVVRKWIDHEVFTTRIPASRIPFPTRSDTYTLWEAIVLLNDAGYRSRKAIAEWVESLEDEYDLFIEFEEETDEQEIEPVTLDDRSHTDNDFPDCVRDGRRVSSATDAQDGSQHGTSKVQTDAPADRDVARHVTNRSRSNSRCGEGTDEQTLSSGARQAVESA